MFSPVVAKKFSFFTQIVPVVSCSDVEQIETIMHKCGIVKANVYNKLGSLKGWGLKWMQANAIVKQFLKPCDLNLPPKLFDWSVEDCAKAIGAGQIAAIEAIESAIYQKTSDKLKRKELINLLKTNPTKNHWLHRQFREKYHRGHTYARNQIVLQTDGYTCKRLGRNTVELKIAGLKQRKRITLKLKCRHIITGQIRVIKNELGKFEIHCCRKRPIVAPVQKPEKELGVDKGYTEAFYTSDGNVIGDGLGKLLTVKTERIKKINENRNRLRCYAETHSEKAEKIKKHNLGYKTNSRKLAKEKATIKTFIRGDLNRVITTGIVIYAEDLSRQIKNKNQAKSINRKLNQWMKAEVQSALEASARRTGSIVKLVNAAYTSQMCSQTGTLLGSRNGDSFTCYTGDVLQADQNAAMNILLRGSDTEITQYLSSDKVRKILLKRTVQYLASIGKSVAEAFILKWFNPKFESEALQIEAEILPARDAGTVKGCNERVTQTRQRSSKRRSLQAKPAILDILEE